MHHVVLERWSRGTSVLHARNPSVKALGALAFLIAIATTPIDRPLSAALYAGLLLAGILLAGLPLGGVLLRAAVVLPLSGTFALISALLGDTDRALAVLTKSYLSAVAVLLLVATTPLPRLLNGVERLGAPRMVALVVQFLYRYLFVISEQGQHMRQAARCRGELGGGRGARRQSRFRAAAGALAVLFGRSHQRAEAIHRAMLARGFDGRFRPLSPAPVRAPDFLFLALAAGAPIAVRILAEAPPG